VEEREFNAAVGQYQDMVYRVALHYFGVAADAEDAVQEVFLRLYTRSSGFIEEEHLRLWLLRVTINVCKDALKSPWHRRRVSLEAVPEPVFEQPEQAALYREVMALPERYRTVLDLFYYEELSVKEVASLLGVNASTVTTRLSRGRAKLKEHLAEVWQDE
jgi:RNA polymerase sigma-70 factor (ECF subfamily)